MNKLYLWLLSIEVSCSDQALGLLFVSFTLEIGSQTGSDLEFGHAQEGVVQAMRTQSSPDGSS
jgi:hypothetical protein